MYINIFFQIKNISKYKYITKKLKIRDIKLYTKKYNLKIKLQLKSNKITLLITILFYTFSYAFPRS